MEKQRRDNKEKKKNEQGNKTQRIVGVQLVDWKLQKEVLL